MACDRTAQVHAYHDGRLPAGDRAALESHFATCDECARLLADVRAVSKLVTSASLPPVSSATLARYRKAWNLARQRGILRIASWMTAAAAAVLVGSLTFWPAHDRSTTEIASAPSSANWEAVAIMPPPAADRSATDRADDLVELAQWMADDLSQQRDVR
jgi:anti-sigma factor RsiW